jgi:hypothetical protein
MGTVMCLQYTRMATQGTAVMHLKLPRGMAAHGTAVMHLKHRTWRHLTAPWRT